MPTSRPLRDGDFVINLRGGGWAIWRGQCRDGYVLGADFGLPEWRYDYWARVCERIYGLAIDSNVGISATITNGTAPGLYVREGDDTSNWETYRQVLARRVEEAMVARRGGEGGVGVGDKPAAETATRQDDEIRVGDVVEVVSNTSAYTMASDVGGGGRITRIENSNNVRTSYVDLEPCQGLRLPVRRCAGLPDVRKVTSPSLSPQTVAVNASPMPDGEVARIEAAVSDEVRRRISSPLASSSEETTRRRVVNPVPPAVSVSLRPRDFTAAAITDYLQSLGATQVRVRRAPGNPPVVEVAGLSRQAFDTACQNLPVGVQLRAVGAIPSPEFYRQLAADDRRLSNVPPPSSPPVPPSPPSRFSLLEVDADVDAAPSAPPQAPKAPVDLAALQAELRAEREAKRALAAAQTPPGRFDLLECDLPAVPAVAVKPAKAPQPERPIVSPPPPRPRNPVETITDLTAARSPLELARMLEGLNDELSTMKRQREAN